MSALGFGIFAGFALLAILGAIVSVGYLLQQSRGQSRLAQRVSSFSSAPEDEFTADEGAPLLKNIARGGKAIEGWVDTDKESGRLLVQAGWRSHEARLMWYVFQGMVPVAGALLVLAYWIWGGDKNKTLILLCAAFAAFAFSVLIPRWVLRGAAAARAARIKAEVPLFVHLLVLLFEAGLSIRQAMTSLVREGGGVLPELGGEFELVLRQMDAGGETADLLKAMSDTLQVEDLTNVLGVLRQVDRYGGEVREPLLEVLGVLEERRSLDLRERVNLLSGRMTVVMVLFFFPALLIFVAGPAFLSVFRALDQISGK